MAKTFWVQFGSGNPQTFAGLTPTFVIFEGYIPGLGGTTLPSPSIVEAGVSIGLYVFQYEPSPTFAIGFTVDGGSSISSSGDRYVSGALDPIAAVDERVGGFTDSFGSSAMDPTTVAGYLKRLQELLEGDAVFAKGNAQWAISSRGSSTLLRTKNLTNTVTSATKTGV